MLGTIYKIISKSIIDLNIKPQTVKLTELTGEIIVTLLGQDFWAVTPKAQYIKVNWILLEWKKKKNFAL